MVNKVLLMSVAIFILINNIKGQVFLEESSERNFILVKEKSKDKELILDSLINLDIAGNYDRTYYLSDSLIYYSWKYLGIDGNGLSINIYKLNKFKKLHLIDNFNISDKEYFQAFGNGIFIEFKKEGIALKFERGTVREIILSYENLRLKDIGEVLKRLSNM